MVNPDLIGMDPVIADWVDVMLQRMSTSGDEGFITGVGPDGVTPMSAVPGIVYYKLLEFVRRFQRRSPVVDLTRGGSRSSGSGMVEAGKALSFFGVVPMPVPTVPRVPYAVVADLWWPCQPSWSQDSPFLAAVTLEGGPTSDVDRTWYSPALPVAGDVAISDFMYATGAADHSLRNNNLSYPTTQTRTLLVRRVLFALQNYSYWKLERFMFNIQITRRNASKIGVYVAIVVPRDLHLSTVTDTTGAKVEGGDHLTMPPFSRTNASLAVDPGAAGVPEFPQFYAPGGNAGVAGAAQRIAMMKSSPYTVAWRYLPPGEAGTVVRFSAGNTYSGATPVTPNPVYSPIVKSGSPASASMSFNCHVSELTGAPGVIMAGAEDLTGASVWAPYSFVAAQSYLPRTGGDASIPNMTYVTTEPPLVTSQATDNKAVGFRLVWIPDGPGIADTDGTGAGTSHDIDRTTNGYRVLSSTDGKEVGAYACSSEVGSQYVWFDPVPWSDHLALGAVHTDQA